MEQFQGWAQIISALGVGAILLEGSKALWRYFSGKVGREVNAVARERQRADAADLRADEGDRRLDRQVALTRAVVAIAGRYELRLLRLGVDTSTLEKWPEELALPRDKISVLGDGKEA